tara:strand:- start:4521 stop:6371 length:1851 start_codon:yes stop_codon:yes gene_type:complete
MNLLYGCCGKNVNIATDELKKAAFSEFNNTGEELNHDGESFFLSVINNGEAGITLQKNSGITAALIGNLYNTPNTDFENAVNQISSKDTSGLNTCHGSYALAVLNHHQELVLATDENGLRNIYYAEIDNTIWFSSHLSLLAKALDWRTSIDRSYEDFLLSYGFVPFQKTFYKDIFEIPAGLALIYNQSSGKTFAPVKRADPWQGNLSSINVSDLQLYEQLKAMEEAFLTATEEVAHPSNKAAVLLGGVDSALVAAALKRIGKEVTTYSFFYEKNEFNQTHTDTLAKHLGINHVWIPITPEVIAEGLANFSKKFNKPTNWPNYLIQTEYVCQQIKQDGHEVCYSGDGCDGIFLGYPRTHVVSKFLDTSFRIPKGILKTVEWALGSAWMEMRLGRPFRVFFNLLRNLSRKPPARGFIPFRIFDDLTLQHIRKNPSLIQEKNVEEVLEILSADTKDLSAKRRAYHGKNTVGVNKAKIAGASDSSGVPIISPYLHPGLSKFAKSLPENLLRPSDDPKYKNLGKYLLLSMASNAELLPEEVIYQPKISAVEGPMDDWYFNELSIQVKKAFTNLPFELNETFTANLLYKKRAEKIYTKYFASDHLTTHEVSMLVTYASFTAR